MRGFLFNQDLPEPVKVYTMLSSVFEQYIKWNQFYAPRKSHPKGI